MKKHLLLILLFFSSMCASAQVEKILGEWRTVDDVTGETKGIVEFYKGDNGLYYGKICYNKEDNTITLRGSIDKRGWIGRSQVWVR